MGYGIASRIEKTGIAACIAVILAGGCDKSASTTDAPAPTPTYTLKSGAELPLAPASTDANVLIGQMVKAYKTVNSLHTESEADVVFTTSKRSQYFQSAELTYRQAPTGIRVIVKDPRRGTRQYVSDGKELVIHDGTINAFIRRPIRTDLAGVCETMTHYSSFLLSPINFIKAAKLPDGFQDLRYVGIEQVLGRRCYKIDGKLSADFRKRFVSAQLIRGSSVESNHGEFSIWLDQVNCLLVKSSLRIAFRLTVMGKDRKPHTSDVKFDATEVVTKLLQNPTIPDEMFRFIPPPGSAQIPIEGASQFK